MSLSFLLLYFIYSLLFLIQSSHYIIIKKKVERKLVAETPRRKAADADQGYDGGSRAGGDDGGDGSGDGQRRGSKAAGENNIDRNNITKNCIYLLIYI